MLRLSLALFILGGSHATLCGDEGSDHESSSAARPQIKKLGTIDCDLVETTPIVFRDRLYRFESVRTRYQYNALRVPHFRFVDVATGKPTASFAAGHDLGSAFVKDDTVYVYGVKGWGTSAVHVFWSKDLTTWNSQVALEQPGWSIYNTSVCQAEGRYIMAFEVGKPKEVVGAAFTNRFAESKDLVHWKLLSDKHVFTKKHYSACPTIRFLDGQYYVIYLHNAGKSYDTHIVRSKDLITWESSPFNPMLKFSPEDRRIASDKLTAAERKRIVGAGNRNNSDVDVCEFRGKVVIYYSWGNQRGIEHLAEAVYKGSLKQFLLSYFP